MVKKLIKEFDTVKYIGNWDKEIGILPGEVGVVIDDYEDGNVEVEFFFPDGTTWLQYSFTKENLELLDPQAKIERTFSRDYIYPLIKSYEVGDVISVEHPETGEVIKVEFDNMSGNLILSTPSLGNIMSVRRPMVKF